MKKVIIITRTSAFARENARFFKAIQDASECEYNKKRQLKKYLFAEKKWEEGVEKKREEGIKENPEKAFGKGLIGEIKGSWKQEHTDKAIGKLMEDSDSEKVLDDNLYACFPTEEKDFEVIMVLCDRIDKDLFIPVSFKMFMNSICADMDIELNISTKRGTEVLPGKEDDMAIKPETNNNILYVHDKQIRCAGDRFIVDDNPKFIEDGFSGQFDFLKGAFCRIAHFSHFSEGKSIFQENIINMNFCGTSSCLENQIDDSYFF